MDWQQDFNKQKLFKLWEIIGKQSDFSWKINGENNLKQILTKEDYKKLKSLNDKKTENKIIREIISPYFKKHDIELKRKLVEWIIFDWGGIHKNIEGAMDWADEIRIFNEKHIGEFIDIKNTHRVSSWSKVFSFYDHENYAIYDSKVSIAINIALLELDNITLFYMPQPQSTQIIKLQREIRKRKKLKSKNIMWGYGEYMELLHASVEFGIIENVLEGETRIFANSKNIMNYFISKHNLKINISNKTKYKDI